MREDYDDIDEGDVFEVPGTMKMRSGEEGEGELVTLLEEYEENGITDVGYM